MFSYSFLSFQQDKNSAKTDDLKAETEKVTAEEEDNGKKMTTNTDDKSEKEMKEDDKRSVTANSDSVKEVVIDKEVL